MRKIAFLDRDGTMAVEPPDQQIDTLEKLRLVEGAIPALLDLKNAGFRFVMVTNQDGLGSPGYPRAAYEKVQAKLLDLLSSQGINFEEVLVCPHLPADGCSCRKPHLGLVRSYLADKELDLAASVVIGDRESDLELARNMGVRGFRLGAWPDVVRRILGEGRRGSSRRKTAETDISAEVELDREGPSDIATGIGFFDHMLEQLARHGGFRLKLRAGGDLHVDDHHTVEDVALCLGAALKAALGDKFGVSRYGFVLPMDEARALVALDLSGRPLCTFRGAFKRESVGGLSTEMVPHFFRSLATALSATLQIELAGEIEHHMIEAAFKGVGRAFRAAAGRSAAGGLPTTKGVL